MVKQENIPKMCKQILGIINIQPLQCYVHITHRNESDVNLHIHTKTQNLTFHILKRTIIKIT